MKITVWLLLLTTLITPMAKADSFQLELGCCGTKQSTSADTKLDSDYYLNIRTRLPLSDFLGAELSLGGFNNLKSKSRRDNAGDYYLTFKSRELMLGLYGKLALSRQWNISASAGWLHYQTKITLHESYFGLLPDQEKQTTENGQGYYANLGIRWRYTPTLSLGPELIYRKQKKLFSNSPRAFDLTTRGALLTATLSF